MQRWLLLIALAALALAGYGATLAFGQGETTGTQTFTNVVTYTIPTVTQTETVTVTAPAPQAYSTEHFDGALSDPAFWYFSPTNTGRWLTWPSDGTAGQAIRVTAEADRSPGVAADGTVIGSSSSYGQLVGVESNVTLSQIPKVHAGWASGDPQTTSAVGKHEETWYRWKQRFPVGYQATPGTQNATAEWHYDRGSEAAFGGSGSVGSPVVDVEATGGTCSGTPNFCTTPPTTMRLLMQVCGGTVDVAHGSCGRYVLIPFGGIQLGHWYDFVAHWVWDYDANVGQVEIWIDGGAPKLSIHRPTQYLRPNGTRGYQEDIGLYDYRYWANWGSSVDYDELTWGPTAASVGFTP